MYSAVTSCSLVRVYTTWIAAIEADYDSHHMPMMQTNAHLAMLIACLGVMTVYSLACSACKCSHMLLTPMNPPASVQVRLHCLGLSCLLVAVGVVEMDNVTLLELEDVAKRYRHPSIIDIKLGYRTWYPTADQRYIDKCKAKDASTTQAALGFKICGMQVLLPMLLFGSTVWANDHVAAGLKSFNISCKAVFI